MCLLAGMVGLEQEDPQLDQSLFGTAIGGLAQRLDGGTDLVAYLLADVLGDVPATQDGGEDHVQIGGLPKIDGGRGSGVAEASSPIAPRQVPRIVVFQLSLFQSSRSVFGAPIMESLPDAGSAPQASVDDHSAVRGFGSSKSVDGRNDNRKSHARRGDIACRRSRRWRRCGEP